MLVEKNVVEFFTGSSAAESSAARNRSVRSRESKCSSEQSVRLTMYQYHRDRRGHAFNLCEGFKSCGVALCFCPFWVCLLFRKEREFDARGRRLAELKPPSREQER